MKRVYVQIGDGDVGKTTTIRKLYEKLIKAYPDATIIEKSRAWKEIYVILKIKKTIIGIESKGDPGGPLQESLRRFVETGCHVIVCACRPSGKTLAAVENLESHGYKFARRKHREGVSSEKAAAENEAEARWMFQHIKSAIEA